MKKKVKEKSSKSLSPVLKGWEDLWSDLNATNIQMVSFLETTLRVNQKIKAEPLVKQWEKLKSKAEKFYDTLEETLKEQNHVEPISIILPWEDDKFKKEWDNWKSYLLEQHGIKISSRTEQKQLESLKKMANGHEESAFEMLDYSISNFYKMFFALDTKKEDKKTKPVNKRKDDDFA